MIPTAKSKDKNLDSKFESLFRFWPAGNKTLKCHQLMSLNSVLALRANFFPQGFLMTKNMTHFVCKK